MLVFSNSHLDPNLKEQIKMFGSDPDALSSRDVRVFIDDKPEPNSKLRKRFRPKGFLIILIVIGKFTKSLSVTNNGFLIFTTKQALLRSTLLFSPVQTVVG